MKTSSNSIETTDTPTSMKLTEEEKKTGEGKEKDAVFKESNPENPLKREYRTSPVGVDEKEKEQSVRDHPFDSDEGDEDKKIEEEGVNEGGRMILRNEQLKNSSFIITTSLFPDTFLLNVISALFFSSIHHKVYPQ
jgi:hypothetical protein